MLGRSFFFLAFAATAVLAGGCHPAIPPERAMELLQSADADDRRHAADALRTDHGVPWEAVPKLLAALDAEIDPEARGAILITLGRSGASEAKPIEADYTSSYWWPYKSASSPAASN